MKSFVKAAKVFFELKEGQKLKDFSDELKDLSMEDRVELSQLLANELGETIELGTGEDKRVFEPA